MVTLPGNKKPGLFWGRVSNSSPNGYRLATIECSGRWWILKDAIFCLLRRHTLPVRGLTPLCAIASNDFKIQHSFLRFYATKNPGCWAWVGICLFHYSYQSPGPPFSTMNTSCSLHWGAHVPFVCSDKYFISFAVLRCKGWGFTGNVQSFFELF